MDHSLLDVEKTLRSYRGTPPFDKEPTTLKALITPKLIKSILPSFIRRLEGPPPKAIQFIDTMKDQETTYADVLAERLPIVLIILLGLKQDQRIFPIVEAGLTDDSLPFKADALDLIFGLKSLGIRQAFESLQTSWFNRDSAISILNPSVYHKFNADGPPPFTFHGSMGRGGEGVVTTVGYRKMKGAVFIRKQLIGRDTGTEPPEVLNMRKLGKNKHCTELVTSYLYEGVWFLILSPVGVCTLHDHLQKPQRYFLEKSGCSRTLMMVDWFGCLAEGLRHLHRNNMVHCDLKPANVFLRSDSTILLGDFGVSRQFEEEASEITAMRQFRNSEYRAPECLSHGEKASRLSDIFSLGCIYLDLLNVMLGGSMSRFRDTRKLQGAAKNKFSYLLDITGTGVSSKSFANREKEIAAYFETLFAQRNPKEELKKLFSLALEMTGADRKERPDIMKVMKTVLGLVSTGFGKPHCEVPTSHHEPKPEVEESESDDEDDEESDDDDPTTIYMVGISSSQSV